ncbi:hypothetical protein [Chitinophaga pinensis]|nr:hypothetical protein [Chitinophaga pinensis]
MENKTSLQPPTWVTPEMTVLPINDITLGEMGTGMDFALEFHSSV